MLQAGDIVLLHLLWDGQRAKIVQIASLAEFQKLMTVIVKKRIILSNSQYGFRARRNTEVALMAQKELIVNLFEHGLYTLGTFINFLKAFDHLNAKTEMTWNSWNSVALNKMIS